MAMIMPIIVSPITGPVYPPKSSTLTASMADTSAARAIVWSKTGPILILHFAEKNSKLLSIDVATGASIKKKQGIPRKKHTAWNGQQVHEGHYVPKPRL